MKVDTVAASTLARRVEPFKMIGVSWPVGAPAHAEVRVRSGGKWGPWRAVEADSGDGPDRLSHERSAVRASSPIWVGEADGFQVRGPSAARARVHLVRHGQSVQVRSSRGRSADANVAAPDVRGRETWVAREPVDEPSVGEVKLAFVHHSAGTNDYSEAQVPDLLRGIQAFHMDVNGWDDIGYNFLVDRFGRIWEGRAGGMHEAVIGAQTEGFNSVSTGVAILGTFGSVPPTSASVEAVIRLLSWKLPHHGVDPASRTTVESRGNDRYPEGASATLMNVSGHRDGKATSCPGQLLYDRLPSIRSEAGLAAAAVMAYARSWDGGVFVDTAQLDVDETPEIVTGADAGGGPELRTFDADGALRSASLVFPEGFRGGVRVAAGNLDNAPGDEIVVGAGPGGGPHVRVLREGAPALGSFFAYTSGFTGGVTVATGNVDGLPGDEIITGPGPGGGPQVRVFRIDGTPIAQFFAFAPAFPGGVRVATADINGDGIDEIVAGAGPGGGPQVRVFRLDGAPVLQFFAYGEAFRGGVFVSGLKSDDGTGDWIATGAGEGGGPHVRVFESVGRLKASFFSGRPTATTGIRVASGSFLGTTPEQLVLAPGRGGPPLVKISRLDGSLVFPR